VTSVIGPEDYREDLGEVVRAYRLYMGLSRPALAKKIDMAFRTYERIEDGTRECPPGFIDTMRELSVRFDDEVDRMIENPRAHSLQVRPGEDYEWHRAIVGRAALAIPIVPELTR